MASSRRPGRPLHEAVPEFIVMPDESGGAWVRCPRSHCGEQHYVIEDTWILGTNGIDAPTRPCPYCFRASLMPGHGT